MLARVLFLCLLTCLIAAATETGSANKCCLPKVPGLCRGLFRRFYYNSLTGKCERFDYGGCGGNHNNFKSQNLCRQECDGTECGNCCLPKEPGFCRGYFPRFYYNGLTGKCERFIYGGCEGNRNNFKSQNLCRQECDGTECVNRCCLPEDPGPCFASLPRYSYDKVTSQCKPFIYGGCHGNRNNFISPQECIEACQDVQC